MIVSLSPCPRDVGSVLSFPTRRSSDLEGVAVVYANLGDVTRVVADRHRAANERCQSWREVAPALEVDAVTLHRSEEHTSELQSRGHLVCRLLLAKKKARGDIRTCGGVL